MKSILTLFLLLLGWTVQSFADDATPDGTIRPVGEVEKVADGFSFTEGPAWDSKRGVLYFTDIKTNTIHVLGSDDKVSSLTSDSGTANGLIMTADGQLLGCQMEGQIAQFDPVTGNSEVYVAQHDGKRFNAPNDLVFDADGGVYFTDPHYRAPDPWPQTVLAVYYADNSGTVTRVTGDLKVPNGVGLSPDGKHLYVGPSDQAEMLVYDIDHPGKLSGERTFCTLKQPEGATKITGADGLTLDQDGNVYITSSLGVQIFSSAGKPVGLIEFPEQPSNVTFAGADLKTLYATARTGLYRVEMPIAGLPSF
ncbi:Gluconolactonase precursor [Rubripirellula tenax]|uniref:Gluconolactonase n=1 Tax=Rubripirellula tenax TaxID=2528015 RepID=A0A5C6FG97_9BACT|nr:SMP-30/gluconolactonase/LRE family protein [Rubripirellula tenax]TWU60806.1 Gluconolactonase precursor [Rubripirellula tenax]